MRVLILLAGLVLAGVRPLGAAAPVLTHVFPAAVERGASTEVKLIGTFDPWPCQVSAGVQGVVFTPGKDPGVVTVAVAADAPVGPCLLRVFNAEGASAPIALVVAVSPLTLENEPNDDFRAPQSLPQSTATINGRHEISDDVDSFAVTLVKGQSLVARVEAYVLAAGFDALLRVVDDAGTILAFNHDHVTLDPLLVLTAPRSGRFIVQTMGHSYPASSDIRFAGGPTCVYRLHLTTGPVVRNTWPLAVRRGAPVEVALEGWNLTEARMMIDPSVPPAAVPVAFSDIPEAVETSDDQMLALPSAVSGRLESPGREDRYHFVASKDVSLAIAVDGRLHGSEIDPWLKILDPMGKELAVSDDDRASLDPRLFWTAPADGTYTAVVGDVTRRGGPEFYYRLSLAPAAPSVFATVASHSFKLEAGKSTEVKVTVSLVHGFNSKLKLAATSLPAGVTAAEVDVPEAGGEVSVTLVAEATAAAASETFQLVLREVEGGREHPVAYSMVTTSENNGVPQGYQQLLINSTVLLWLTVGPPGVPSPSSA